jgi:hypothetical protein
MVQLLAQIYLMTNTQIIVITLSLMFNPTKNALKWIVQLDCLYIVLESVHLDGEYFWGIGEQIFTWTNVIMKKYINNIF